MMYENQILVTYKGVRTFKKKDGTDGSTYAFADMKGREFQMYVKEGVNNIPEGTKVIATQLHDGNWNKEINKYVYRVFYKSVEPAVIKK